MSENREDAIRPVLKRSSADPMDIAAADLALDYLLQELNSVRETPKILSAVLERERALREVLELIVSKGDAWSSQIATEALEAG